MRRHAYAGACVSRHTGYMVGLAQKRNSNAPGGLPTSVGPQRGNTSGTLPSGWFIPMRPRRLCTCLCHCGRHVLSEIIGLTAGPRLLPLHVVCARTAFSPRVRILGLLLGHKQSVNTSGTTLSTFCLNARVSWGWEAH